MASPGNTVDAERFNDGFFQSFDRSINVDTERVQYEYCTLYRNSAENVLYIAYITIGLIIPVYHILTKKGGGDIIWCKKLENEKIIMQT